MIVIHLTGNEVERLRRRVVGQGGFQSLLRRLQRSLVGNQLTLTRDELLQAARYATYGPGGFEDRLPWVARHV